VTEENGDEVDDVEEKSHRPDIGREEKDDFEGQETSKSARLLA
jgi:hypothetical protein